MKPKLTLHPSFIFVLFLISTNTPTYLCEDDAHYTNCINPFKCGNTNLDLRYPFSGENRNGYCGEEKLTCEGDPKITINQIKYRILGWHNTTQTLTMARDDYWDSICVREYKNNTFDNTHFQYDHQYNDFVNVTLFYCPSNSPPSILTEPFGMDTCDALSVYYTLQPGLSYTGTCTVVVIPIFQTYDSLVSENKTTDALRKGFELKWVGNYGNCETCSDSGGECGVDDGDGNGKFQCFCDDGPHSASCTGKRDKKRKLIILGVTGSAIIAGVLISISILCVRYKSPTWQANFGLVSKSNQNIEAFLKIHGSLALKRYKLSHVKKMTNNFKVKLGQGGFGAVYKGKLSNGSLVAVKMLNALKKNGEEFMNEVASISRTSHVNVVTLLGFCLEGRKRALIYEFMPNGSLDKFIYRKRSETRPPLSWDIIYEIARDIARGLEYLHKGCNTRIFHFDIKPHNILLDENFYAKISDFGLAKLCPRNESIVSLSDARGTMGYVAPEMWNRNLGRVSHKSDVYSYGMMLLEMVGGRKNINVEASHTSEIYFPHWAYNKLELDNDLRPDMVMTIEENQIAKRLAIVGLWCTQTFPNDRPTMSKVIDMLEGNMDSLQIPPKPLLSSPTRSVPKYSISLN